MRWIVAFVTACCLMVAGGARPEIRAARGHDAQLARATVAAVAMAPRRDGSGRRDLRSDAYVLPVVATSDVPRRVWCVASERGGADVCERAAPTPVSRGPPRG